MIKAFPKGGGKNKAVALASGSRAVNTTLRHGAPCTRAAREAGSRAQVALDL